MRRTVLLTAALALLGACSGEPTANDTDLATLRSATDQFHDLAAAAAAGYDTQAPPGCFTDPAGAMGLHYMKSANVGTLEVAKPQLLMYEPQQNGSLKLLGVEYLVPGAPTDTPPVIFDQQMHYNTTFQVWVLHVWAWKDNPSGLFADWNPKVTCDHAAVLANMSHH
jgi:hypothetical protein